MKSYKKNIKKKTLWLLFLSIFLVALYFVLSCLLKLNSNYLYKGELNSKTVYFKTNSFLSKNAYLISPDNKIESFYQDDLKQIINKKIVYKGDLELEYIEGNLSNNFLYFTIHTNKKNSLIRIDMNTNEVNEIINENTSGEYPTVFSINKIMGDYLVMFYNGITGGFGDIFILNVTNKNRVTINNKDISRNDLENINIDLKNKKITYPKGKMTKVNCEDSKEYEMGCEGMYEINGKFFDVISTKEVVKLDLP